MDIRNWVPADPPVRPTPPPSYWATVARIEQENTLPDILTDNIDQWDTVAVHPITPGVYGHLDSPRGAFYTPIVALLEQKCFLTLRTYRRPDGTFRRDDIRHEQDQEVRFTPGYLDKEGELLPLVDHEAFQGLEHERNVAQPQCETGIVYF